MAPTPGRRRPSTAAPRPRPSPSPVEAQATVRSLPVTPPTRSQRSTLDEHEEYVRVLYVGDPGLTKTTSAADMAHLGRVVYIDAEHRLKASPLKRRGIPVENIEVVRDISYPALLELCADIEARLAEGEPIVGIVWDSISEQHAALLVDLVDQSVAQAERGGTVRHPTRTFQEDYGDMTAQMSRILHRLFDLPLHIALTALPRRDQDENKQLRVTAGVTPALLQRVQGLMDFILFMQYESFSDKEGDGEYSALCRPVGNFDAKDAYGVLPTRLVDPTFTRVLAYMREELTPKTDPLQKAAGERRRALSAGVAAEARKAIAEGNG